MKRVTILVLMSLFFGIAANAQTSQRQKIIHMAAVRIAETIQIQDSDKEAFIVLYQNYKKESAAIMAVKTQPSAILPHLLVDKR